MNNNELIPIPLEGEDNIEKNVFQPTFNSILILFFAFLFSFLALFIYLLLPNITLLQNIYEINEFSKETKFLKKSFLLENIPKETTFFELKIKFKAKQNSIRNKITFNTTYTMISKENDIEIYQKGTNFINNSLYLKSIKNNGNKVTNDFLIYRNNSFHGNTVNFTLIIYTKMKDIEIVELIFNYNSIIFSKLNQFLSSFLLIISILFLLYLILRSLDSHSSEEFSQYSIPLRSSFIMLFIFYFYYQKNEKDLFLLINYLLEISLQTINIYQLRIIKLRILIFIPFLGAFIFIMPLNEKFKISSLFRIAISLISCFSTFIHIKNKKLINNESYHNHTIDLAWFLFGLFSAISIFLSDFILFHLSEEIFIISRKLLILYIDTSISLLTSFIA